ncbi:MAG: glycosyl transferase family 2 [Flavobacterium sp. BFFFF2]|nr:MAG: glycosyl transferase family 2 [Flavobacterium sp. BFFFF2]
MSPSLPFALIICTYNRPTALRKLLHTVLQQTCKPSSIVIIDASEGSLQVDFFQEFDGLPIDYYVAEPHEKGLTRQRNAGIQRVKQSVEVVCFVDDDCLLSPTYFEQLNQAYLQHPEAIGIGGYISNEAQWEQYDPQKHQAKSHFILDGYARAEAWRLRLRKAIWLGPNKPPGIWEEAGHTRSIGYLPPTGRIYPVDFLMGGVSSFKASIFKQHVFSTYFEGYGLYEDLEFCLRIRELGSLYVATAATLEHWHEPAGRPNQFKYGQMVVRNGWLIRHTYSQQKRVISTVKWHVNTILLSFLLLSKPTSKAHWAELLGRMAGLFSLVYATPQFPSK